MGLGSFLGKQFIDVVEWNESEQGVLSFRYPMQDQEIQNGAKLTVRESQLALFVNEGRIADSFEPGLHTLNTRTLPILTNLMNWDKAFASPFKSDVYFFSTRLQTDQKWGTATPLSVRDKEFGVIRLRAYGIYSYKVGDPKLFFNRISGTREQFTTIEIEGQLRGLITTGIASSLGAAEVPFLDMAANQSKFSEKLKNDLAPQFQTLGLELDNFLVESLSLPEEIQKFLDQKAGMGIIGDMQRYVQFQTASSISTAAANEGGIAGAGAGLGAGLAMGQMMAQAFQGAAAPKGGAGGGAPGEDVFQKIEKLHELMKKGIISEAEFNAKKAELLASV